MSDVALRSLERQCAEEGYHRRDYRPLWAQWSRSGQWPWGPWSSVTECDGTCRRACCREGQHRPGYWHPCTKCGDPKTGSGSTGWLTGTLEHRLEFAAYLGHELARDYVEAPPLPWEGWDAVDQVDLRAWLRDLDRRWEPSLEFMVSGVVAAGREVLRAEERGQGVVYRYRDQGVVWDPVLKSYRYDVDAFTPAPSINVLLAAPTRLGLDAAAAWAECPCEEHLEQCGDRSNGIPGWLWLTLSAIRNAPLGFLRIQTLIDAFEGVTSRTTEAAVRRALQAEWIPRVLP